MREDTRACKFIQRLKREDKEEWGEMSRRRMEPLKHERMVWGLLEKCILTSLAFVFFPTDWRDNSEMRFLHSDMCLRQNNMLFFLASVKSKYDYICSAHLGALSSCPTFKMWCNIVNPGANHSERKTTEQVGEIPAHSNPHWSAHGLCTFAPNMHTRPHTQSSMLKRIIQAWISTERIPVYKHYDTNLAFETFLIPEHPARKGGWTSNSCSGNMFIFEEAGAHLLVDNQLWHGRHGKQMQSSYTVKMWRLHKIL